ncbi:hypothetical protein [Streptomyces sp. NPDC004286]
MPSIHYPYPNPKNDRERAENVKAEDEYERIELGEDRDDFVEGGE